MLQSKSEYLTQMLMHFLALIDICYVINSYIFERSELEMVFTLFQKII